MARDERGRDLPVTAREIWERLNTLPDGGEPVGMIKVIEALEQAAEIARKAESVGELTEAVMAFYEALGIDIEAAEGYQFLEGMVSLGVREPDGSELWLSADPADEIVATYVSTKLDEAFNIKR